MRRVLSVVLVAGAISALGAAGASAIGIEYSCTPGAADCSGWHTTSVTLRWTAIGGSLQCSPVQVIATDGRNSVPCTASNANGDTASATAHIAIDQTPPTVTGATVSRLPDQDGWYRAPVQVTFAGTDPSPGSGLLSCSSITYAGPDGDPANVTGTCTDVAGNVSAPFLFALRFDTTPPAIGAPTVTTGDRVVRVRWQPPPDAASLEVVRTPGRDGAASSVVHTGAGGRLTDHRVRNGRHYQYTLIASDAAGNIATATAGGVPGRRLIAPVGGAVVTTPPLLSWTSVQGARYYNVQVYRRGHKMLSAWPRRAHLSLRRSWRYAGRRHHLAPGRYRWYVWPGRGRPSDRRFGALIGRGEFVVSVGGR
jgi:hypothetical protein